MECSTTSTRRQRRRGSSLIELLVATAISVIILAASGSLLLYTARSLEGVSNYMGMAKESRLALDRMSQEIRMSDRLVSFSTNHLAFNFEGDSLVYA